MLDFEADGEVCVRGWHDCDWAPTPSAAQAKEASGGVSLPSFSGLLPTADSSSTPLLRYPLTLGPARRVVLRPAMRTRCAGAGLSAELRAVLGGPIACPCIQADAVT
eukprot:7369419-Prymnesium_polylepis.1